MMLLALLAGLCSLLTLILMGGVFYGGTSRRDDCFSFSRSGLLLGMEEH